MKALGLTDLRVAAAPLIPEVLPPDSPPENRYIGRYADAMNGLKNRAKELIRSVEYYAPRVTSRKEMWNVNQLIQRAHDEIYEQLQALRKIEEAWEEEDFQAEEAAWQQRQRR